MDILFAIKIVIIVVLVFVFLLVAILTRNASLKTMLLTNGIVMVLLAGLGYGFIWLVDVSMKSATLVSVNNRRNTSLEQLVVYGKVKNTGKYTIKKLYVKTKVINNVSGKKLSSNGAQSGSFSESCEVARDLRAGEIRQFSCTINYPPNYQLAEIRHDLSWN
ncbi:MAG: hypothetical protein KU28_01120 [Sulfurovum sp. PC08-66]|nr:MAG: hypothetical protein KU28_01120 [Sulfurovum sp. PC08-66]KIM12557.1 MAG: hypothetical protein KU37_01235 [Sulfuricurvum sp. PC08-66]